MPFESQVETTQQPEVEQSQEAVNELGGTQADPQEAPPKVEEQKPQTPAWVERRFSEMTKARHDAQREAEQARAEAETYRRMLEATQRGEQPPQTPQTPSAQPQVNDEQRIQQAAQRLNETQMFNLRCNTVFEEGKAAFPDFESSVKNLGMVGATQEFIAGLVGLEDAHKVIHALGTNPDEAVRILALPALQQGRELERLAAKAPAKPVTKPVSNAPEPIQNTTDASGTSGSKPLHDMSIDEFMKARNQRPKR
jgi:hypothetical protein